MTENLHFHFSLSCIGEGNGNPLQYSPVTHSRILQPGESQGQRSYPCWAAVYGVAQSRTRLMRLSSSSSSIGLGFPGGSAVNNLPTRQEMWVQSLCQEDPLKKEMATHSSILAWKISWTEETSGLQSIGLQRIGHN